MTTATVKRRSEDGSDSSANSAEFDLRLKLMLKEIGEAQLRERELVNQLPSGGLVKKEIRKRIFLFWKA